MKKILVLPGDGIGPEIVGASCRIIEWFAAHRNLNVELDHQLLHGACYDRYGVFLKDETLADAADADAVLVGAEGGPKWDNMHLPGALEDKSGLSKLRLELDLYANLRPVRPFESLIEDTPFKPAAIRGVDFVILRELTGGIYFGQLKIIETLDDGSRRGIDTQVYTTPEVERIARFGFELARQRRNSVCSVEKSNVMESGVMWRQDISRIHRENYADVELNHMLADACAMEIVANPRQFDVIVTDNLFGDLLSDGAGPICASLGMLPSASLGPVKEDGRRSAIYEPVHGSAPDIAGQNIANPLGTVLSIAMMMEWSFDNRLDSALLYNAVDRTLARGCRTADIAADGVMPLSTEQMCDAVIDALEELKDD